MTQASESGERQHESTLEPPERIGPYHLLELIGEGGVGVVYVAEQVEPVRRKVALKLIKAGMDTREVIARFHSERQALALMSHPNIARILEAGATDGGRPYFVMEYVPGVPLLDYCDQQRLTVAARLRLFIDVCGAVQHAHQKGIIHRDIKPSNLLIKEDDGRQVPKVIDFGVAKAIGQRLGDLTVHTRLGGLLGTPEYISPEQARMTGLDVDTHADVYSLGAVLYELLTGARPFDFLNPGLGLAEIQAGILEQEPRLPSVRVTVGETAKDRAKARRSDPAGLSRRLRHDLDWIVQKALEKDRNHRYSSASELAADVERTLLGQPVVAGPHRAGYRLRRFLRRHRLLLLLGGLATLLLIGGLFGTSLGLIRARQQAANARVQTAIAQEVHSFLTQDLLAAVAPERQGIDVTMRQVLDQAAQRIAGRFGDQPLVEVALRQTIGRTYRALGDYDAAIPHLERAVEIRDQSQGAEHLATLRACYDLGNIYRLQGRYDEAETFLLRTVEGHRQRFGDEDLETQGAVIALATLYQVAGRHAESEALYLEALKVREKHLGRTDMSTVVVLENLAILYQHTNRWPEAERLQIEGLQARKQVYGPEHLTTLNSVINLSALYLRLERYDQAEVLLLDNIEPMRRVMGEEHPRSLMMANNLGYLYLRQRRFGEAESILLENFEVKKRVFQPNHPSILEAIENLIELYSEMGAEDKLVRHSADYLRISGLRAADEGASAKDKNIYAWQLLTTAARQLRDPQTALRFALDANQATAYTDAGMLATLARAYAETGDLGQAIRTAHQAIAANVDISSEFHQSLEASLARYQRLQEG